MNREEEILDAAGAFARRCRYEEGHSRQVTRLALELFDGLRPLHGLGGEERLLLQCAGLLHDIGWMEGQKAHHKTSLRLILSEGLMPLDERERSIVGSVARYHRKALPDEEHGHFAALSEADRQVVRVLAGVLRVADGLDRTHTDAVRALRAEIGPDAVVIRCRSAAAPWAEFETARKKGDLLELVLGRPLAFEAGPGGDGLDD